MTKQVLLKPLLSEKSLAQQALDRYTFFVEQNCKKSMVKASVEDVFKVKVLKVWFKKKPGENKKTGKKKLTKKTADRKIAVVQLEKGQKIEALSH